VAEGAGKGGHEFLRYLKIAMGSTFEMEAQLIASRDLKFLLLPDFDRLNSQCQEVRRMLDALSCRVASSLNHRKPRRRTNR
jgi:four helix bundle protein